MAVATFVAMGFTHCKLLITQEKMAIYALETGEEIECVYLSIWADLSISLDSDA
jgi:hypothetical protein